MGVWNQNILKINKNKVTQNSWKHALVKFFWHISFLPFLLLNDLQLISMVFCLVYVLRKQIYTLKRAADTWIRLLGILTWRTAQQRSSPALLRTSSSAATASRSVTYWASWFCHTYSRFKVMLVLQYFKNMKQNVCTVCLWSRMLMTQHLPRRKPTHKEYLIRCMLAKIRICILLLFIYCRMN